MRDRAYLVAAAVGAVNTWNAWSPLLRKNRASAVTWAPAAIAAELPLANLAVELGITAAAAKRGALHRRAGRLGLALHALSWTGLVALHRASLHAPAVLERALVEGLGEGYRERVAEAFAPPAEVPIRLTQVVTPVPRLRRRYALARDLAYGDLRRRNHLDIWRRDDLPDDAGAPVLLQIHGGAWVFGDKAQQGAPLMSHLAERGWVCVAANYRLSPRSTWPDQIVDVKRAIAWIKEHIAAHGGDPSFVVVTGGSAGGHLAALAALTPNAHGFQSGFEDVDTSVQAAVPMYGIYDFTNRDGTGRVDMEDFLARHVLKSRRAEAGRVWDEASPMTWVGPDAPPFFIAHGTNDVLVPVEQARAFVQMLRDVSTSPVVFAELPRAHHAFDVLPTIRTIHTVRAIDRFLAVVRSQHGAP